MERDFATWNEKIAAALRAAGLPDFPRKLEAALKSVFDFDVVMIFCYKGAEAPACLYHNVGSDMAPTVIDAYIHGPYLLDPFYRAALDPKMSGILQLRKMAPDQFYSSEYYRQHYGRTGIRDEVGILCRPRDGSAVVISFTRPVQTSVFGRRDLDGIRGAEPMIRTLVELHWPGGPDTPGEAPAAIEEDPINHTLHVMADGLLTPREVETTALILRGHSSRSIAETLGIVEGTVKIHRKNIYHKLGASSQSELFSMFIRQLSGKR